MAYVSKHFRSVLGLGGQIGGNMWVYDTADAVSDVYAAGYISDGKDKGVRKGDLIFVRRWNSAVPTSDSELKTADGAANDLQGITIHWAIGINATTGAVDLTDGLAITATNT